MLVVFLYYGLFVFLILGGYEFLGSEEIDNMVVIRFLHCLVDLQIRKSLVSCNINLAYFRLSFLVHSYQHTYVTRTIRIVTLNDLYICIMESLLCQIFGYHCFGVVLQIRGHLTALSKPGLHFHILFLAFLQAFELYGADTGTLFQGYNQPNLVVHYLFGFNLDGRE